MDLQRLTKNNRDSVGLSENCGCLFCKRIFPSQLVKNYISETNEPTTIIHTKPTTEEDDYQEIVRTVTEHLKKEKEKKRLGIDVEDEEEEDSFVEEEEPMKFDANGKTAVCPFCLVDSVVSQKDVPELDKDMLSEMSAFYIENYNDDDENENFDSENEDGNENEDNEDNESYDDNHNDSKSENEGSNNEDL